MTLSAEFHSRVAACTHNAAVEMLIQSFRGPMLMSLNEAQTIAPACNSSPAWVGPANTSTVSSEQRCVGSASARTPVPSAPW